MNSVFVGTLIGLALTPILCQAQPNREQNALDTFRSLVRHHADSYKPNGEGVRIYTVDSTIKFGGEVPDGKR